jgi:hypothetical protein
MSWNYHVPYQEDFADRNPRRKEDAAFDKLDAQGVLHVVQRAMASETEKAKTEQFHKDVETFRHMNAAYLDSDFNKNAMVHHWTHVLGVTIPTLAEIEETYFALRESGVLQLNQKAVAKENQEEVLRRAAEYREQREAAEFNEADAYTMSLEELEARCRGWK